MKDLTCENFSLQIPYLKTEWMKMWGWWDWTDSRNRIKEKEKLFINNIQ
jgi:hypothetical protein